LIGRDPSWPVPGDRLCPLFCTLLAVWLPLGLGCDRHQDDPALLRVLVEKAPASLDPRYGSDQASSRAQALLYRGLVRTGDDLSPTPDLAESVVFTDPCRLHLRLKAGVRFHDGTVLTAEDVFYTLSSILEGSSYRKADLAGVLAIDLSGPLDLDLLLNRPDASLPSRLTMGIVPAGLEDAAALPIGTGPYRFAAWRGPKSLELVRAGTCPDGAFERVRIQAVQDEMARLMALRKGSVDLLVNDLSPELFRSLARDRRYRAVTSQGSNYAYLMLNCDSPRLRDTRIRQALALAINREEMRQKLIMGLAREATGLLSPESWAYHRPGRLYRFDQRKARRLLREAGALPLHLTYKTSASLASRAKAAVIQDYLRRVGVDLTIESYEWATFYDDIKKGNFELASLVWVGITDPDALRIRFHSKMVPPLGANRERYQNPELDRLLDEASTTFDRKARKAAYREAQEILARDLPYISLWYKDNFALAKRTIQGIRLGPFAGFRFIADLRRTTPGE